MSDVYNWHMCVQRLTMLWMCSQILLNLRMLPEMRVKVMACRQADGVSEAATGERSTCIRTWKFASITFAPGGPSTRCKCKSNRLIIAPGNVILSDWPLLHLVPRSPGHRVSFLGRPFVLLHQSSLSSKCNNCVVTKKDHCHCNVDD